MQIKEIKIANVLKAYSGAIGCMCGCKGKYSYASAHAELGTKERGYAVDAEDISDRSIKIIAGKIKKLSADAKIEGNCLYVQTETRMYALYFKGN